jgi:hypothetical protein
MDYIIFSRYVYVKYTTLILADIVSWLRVGKLEFLIPFAAVSRQALDSIQSFLQLALSLQHEAARS